MTHDDASWHFGGDFPADLPDEAGATHIGMFVAWALLNRLGSELHMDDFSDGFNQLIARNITPDQYFLANCDGKFTDEDLSDEGNAFATAYFETSRGKYLEDYAELLCRRTETLYHVEDSWQNFDLIGQKIRQRYDQWKLRLQI